MLVAWLAYTALMTLRSGADAHREQNVRARGAAHVTGGPAPAQSYTTPASERQEG
jgi:hypothetical protein